MRAFEELTKQMEEDRRRALEERQARIDLHDLLSTEAGYRWLSRLLERLGAGRMTASEEAQVMKNIAEQIRFHNGIRAFVRNKQYTVFKLSYFGFCTDVFRF